MSFRSVKSLRRANTDALVEKQLWYCNLFIFYKDCVFIAVERGTICQKKVYERDTFSVKNGI